jgi:predicted nucleotidyltransferase
MLIDPLNIFQEIKSIILSDCSNVTVYAFGSRVTGKSTSQKWDFDVLVVNDEGKIEPESLKLFLRDQFDGRRDENGKEVKVDVWTINSKDFEAFVINSKNVVNVSLL